MVSTEGAVVEDDDEGYRTSPGSDTSPQSNNTASPPPKMAKKVLTVVISQVFPQNYYKLRGKWNDFLSLVVYCMHLFVRNR